VGRPTLERSLARRTRAPARPARAGCRPPRVLVTPRPGPPGRCASGTPRHCGRYRRKPRCGQPQRRKIGQADAHN